MKIPHMIHSNGRVDCRIVFALTACLCLFAAQSGAQLDAKVCGFIPQLSGDSCGALRLLFTIYHLQILSRVGLI